MSFLEYLYNALFVTQEHHQLAIAFIPAATLALGAVQTTKSFMDKPDKPDPVETYDPAKDTALQERKSRLKQDMAMGTGVDQRLRNINAASTAQGIGAAMEAGKSANYISDINKFIEDQRTKDIELGLQAANRQELKKKEYIQALADESSKIQSAKNQESQLALQEQQAYNADKANRQKDLFGGVQTMMTGLADGGIGATDKFGRYQNQGGGMTRSEWRATGKPMV
jgi:hypothetical protein